MKETAVAGTALRGLREHIRGEVIIAGEAGYDEARRVWNGMIDRRPALVVRASGNADVIAAVRYAREQGLPVAVRGGGHNVAGTAVADGAIVIDLGAMTNVFVDTDRRIARAGGGARLGDFDHETQAFGLATPLGVVSRTGIAGLTLHGGLGYLTRRLGLSCDNLIAADVVTADGQLVHADAERNPDLLWALRGGGGNFGVVTSFDYRLHPIGPDVWMIVTFYPGDEAGECLRQFGQIMSSAPNELMALGIYWTAPYDDPMPTAWRGQPAFVVVGCWSGPLEEGDEATKPLRELTTPVIDMSGPMPFVAAQREIFDPDYPDGHRYYWKSIYLSALDAAAIDVVGRYGASRPSPDSSIDVWTLGGAIREEPEGGSAFAGRDEPWLVGIEANWDDPEADAENLAWARDLYGELQAISSAGAYLNFPGFAEEGEELLRASYGSSWERLKEVKAKYDPENVFRSNFNIPAA